MILSAGLVTIFNVLFIVLLILIGIFTAVAAASLRKNPLTTADSKLKQAYGLLIGAAVVSFVAMLIIIGVLVYFFATRKLQALKGQGLGGMGWILLILAVIAVLIVGALSSAAAAIMRQSPNWTNAGSDKSAYTWSIVAAVFSFVLLFAIIIAMVIFYLRGRKKSPLLVAPAVTTPVITPVVTPVVTPVTNLQGMVNPLYGQSQFENPLYQVENTGQEALIAQSLPRQETQYIPMPQVPVARPETQYAMMPQVPVIGTRGAYVPALPTNLPYVAVPRA